VSIKRLPHVQFFTQRISIPGISLQPISTPTPFNPLYETADRLNYNEFNLMFIIDERMNNFIEIFNWMHGIAFPQKFNQYRNLQKSEEGLRSDISVIIYNSSKNPQIEVHLKDCFPIGLSEISLDTTTSGVEYPQASATFAYNSYSIKQLK
jgi:hypothetical protein